MALINKKYLWIIFLLAVFLFLFIIIVTSYFYPKKPTDENYWARVICNWIIFLSILFFIIDLILTIFFGIYYNTGSRRKILKRPMQTIPLGFYSNVPGILSTQ